MRKEANGIAMERSKGTVEKEASHVARRGSTQRDSGSGFCERSEASEHSAAM